MSDTDITALIERLRESYYETGPLAREAAVALEALQEQLRHFGELHRAEWQSQVDRAEKAEAALAELDAAS